MKPAKRARLDSKSTRKSSQNDNVNVGSEVYNMDHPYRGYAIILHHYKFDKKLSNVETREGSEYDLIALKETLAELGFDVSVYTDKKFATIQSVINKFSRNTDHRDSDCLAIFVLTHGLENNTVFAKDAPYNLQELWTPFTSENCPSLAGKPKLFFIQACRGNKSDNAIELRHTEVLDCVSDTDTYTKPACEDFLIVHSSLEGYGSYRDISQGSWFIQTLCKELQDLIPHTDLLKITTRIVGRVALDFETGSNCNPEWNHKKQVPYIHSTLTKDIYLYPKDEYDN